MTPNSIITWICSHSFEQKSLMIQTAILTLGTLTAIGTLFYNRNNNKRLSTLDLIIHQRTNVELNDAIDIMTKLAREHKNADLSKYLDDKESVERKSILKVLNHREFVSLGINTGIINEKIYKKAYYNMFLRDWKYLEKTIKKIRTGSTGSNTNFQEFERVATKWQYYTLKNYQFKIKTKFPLIYTEYNTKKIK